MRRPRWLTDDQIAEMEVSQTRLWNIHKNRRDYISNNLRKAREFILYALDALPKDHHEAAMVGTTEFIAPRSGRVKHQKSQ